MANEAGGAGVGTGRTTSRTSSQGGSSRTPPPPGSSGDRLSSRNPATVRPSTAAPTASRSPSAPSGIDRGAPTFNARLHSSAIPHVLPGQLGVFGQTWARGTLVRNVNSYLPGKNYGFRFYYNPESIDFSSPYGFGQVPAAADGIQFPSLFGSLGTISFTVLLNRTEDIYAKSLAPFPVLGSTKLADLGTQHDLEVLYRTINGESINKNNTADRGFIYPTPVDIRFSNALKGTFFLTSVAVKHIKFGATMAPMVSLLTISGTRFTSENPTPNGGSIRLYPGDSGVGSAVTTAGSSVRSTV